MRIRIFDIENWHEIGTTLSRNKTRTFLTAFGIFWGTAMLALLLGGAGGLEGMLKRNFEGFSTNMGGCFTQRTTVSFRGFNKGRLWDLTDHDIAMIRRSCPIIDRSTTLSSTGGTIKYGTKSSVSQIQGVESDFFRIVLPVVNAGRVLNESDDSQMKKVALIGKNIASELFGDDDPIGKYISVNGVYFLVVGVVSQTSEATLNGRLEDSVVLPSTTYRHTFNTGDKIGAFVYTALQGHSPDELQPTIRRIASANHYISPDDDAAITFINISEAFNMVDKLFLGINLLALFVGTGTLLAGIIGVGNIMWIIVKERTQEIGIRRAIGAKPRDIIAQILSESMVLTSIAGLAGICLATAVLYITDRMTYDPVLGSAHFQMTFSGAILIMATFLLLGTAAGLIPAVKAMRIKPIEALNDK